jgi:uncharacterized protein YaaW (UPF0174 family)
MSNYDPDLTKLLANASNDDLDPLVGYILNAELTELLSISDEYKLYKPNHTKYVDLIEKEIRLFGGNSFINLFRGTGPSYSEIVSDVADKLDVKYNKHFSVDEIESAILMAFVTKSFEKMTSEEKRVFLNEMGLGHGFTSLPLALPVVALQTAIKASGFVAYKLAVIVANGIAKQILGRGLSMAANAALTRSVAIFAGPIGWAVTAIWTMLDIAGPAYRVTIPCVAHIAMLRQQSFLAKCSQCNSLYTSGTLFCPNCGSKLPSM